MAVNNISTQKTVEQIIQETAKSTGTRNTGELGKDDFLNLLVTQLRYQDPLKPVDDKEFIAQMAQFSSLEQMQNMNGSLSQSQAYTLMGKHVTGSLVDETTKEVRRVTGDVTGVKVEQGKTFVVVKGRDIPVERITEVTEGLRSSQSNILGYSEIVGRRADGGVYDSETGDIIAVSGVVGSIQKGVYEDYAVMDGIQAAVSGILSDIQSTDPNFRVDYLRNNTGEMVEVEITDKAGAFVAIRALLKDFEVSPDGTITATFDKLNVPVESITNLNRVSKTEISAYTGLIGFDVTGSIHDSRFANQVTVRGTVKSIEAGQYENFVIVDGVEAEIVDVVTDRPDADPGYKKVYLSENTGKELKVTLRDLSTGRRVSAIATVAASSIDENGRITAVLDNLRVPADSITDIMQGAE